MKLSKLEKLLIGEVSGVDDPANEIPGWMVMKSREGAASASASEERKPTLKEKLAGFFESNDEQEIEMTKDELNEVLDERFAALTESLSKSTEEPAAPVAEAAPETETVAKAEEAPVAEEVPAVEEAPVEKAEETPAEEAPAFTAEALTKAIEDGVAAAIQPVLGVIDAVIDRFEPIESALAIRKSLDGQETSVEGDAKPATSPVAGAIRKALNL